MERSGKTPRIARSKPAHSAVPWKSSIIRKPPRSRYSRNRAAARAGSASAPTSDGVEPGVLEHGVVGQVDDDALRGHVDRGQAGQPLAEVVLGVRPVGLPARPVTVGGARVSQAGERELRRRCGGANGTSARPRERERRDEVSVSGHRSIIPIAARARRRPTRPFILSPRSRLPFPPILRRGSRARNLGDVTTRRQRGTTHETADPTAADRSLRALGARGAGPRRRLRADRARRLGHGQRLRGRRRRRPRQLDDLVQPRRHDRARRARARRRLPRPRLEHRVGAIAEPR